MSSMRSSICHALWRAYSQLNRAVRAPPSAGAGRRRASAASHGLHAGAMALLGRKLGGGDEIGGRRNAAAARAAGAPTRSTYSRRYCRVADRPANQRIPRGRRQWRDRLDQRRLPGNGRRGGSRPAEVRAAGSGRGRPGSAAPREAAPAPSAAPASYSERQIIQIIHEAADRHNQPRDDMLRVARCESNLDPRAINGPGNTHGLFQFLPGTFATTPYAEYDIYDPWANANAPGRMWSEGRRTSGFASSTDGGRRERAGHA